MTTKEPKRLDISHLPELLRIAQEVRDTRDPCFLFLNGEEVAQITPVRPSAKRRRKGRPITEDDPLWNIIGIGRSGGPGDTSANKYKYLAEAYLPKPQ